MKKLLIILGAVLVIMILAAGPVSAQNTNDLNKEQEKELIKAIEDQKKAMIDEKMVREKALEELQKQQEELNDKLRDFDADVQAGDSASDVDVPTAPPFRWSSRARSYTHAFPPFVNDMNAFDFHVFESDNESTTWDFSKKINDKSIKSEYTFDVEKTSNTVVMSVMGDCKSGEIRIKIQMPNGKTYSDVVIDEFGNLNWRKSFSISESENQDKAGSWKFIITSKDATGYFKISLQAY
jgi:hypothetical protein